MEQLNSLSFDRLRLVNNYLKLAKQLENYLTNARLNFSKAKTLHGITLTYLADPDSINLVSQIRLDDRNGFRLFENEDKVKKIKSRKTEKNKKEEFPINNSFRPFGILEPLVAKEGRKTMLLAINLICEMATLQSEINVIEKKMVSTRNELTAVDIESIIGCLKI